MTQLRFKFVFGAVITVNFIFYCLCYPYGPPLSVCGNGLPVHIGNDSVTNPPQTKPCPFQITVNVTSYSPGEVISVKVSSAVGEMFKGLFLQMREVPNFDGEKINRHPVGSFSRRVANTKLSACDVGLDTAFHKDPYFKMTTELDWKAPLLMRNDVIVRATILMDFSTYWINVESKTIKLTRPERLPAEDLERPWVDEILKTVKADDKITSRNLVKERFNKGFKGVLDPNGYIMVQYVNDLLPFQDSHYGKNNSDNHDNDIVSIINSTLEQINTQTNHSEKETVQEILKPNITENKGNVRETSKSENKTASEGGFTSDNLQKMFTKTKTPSINQQDISTNKTEVLKNTDGIKKEPYLRLLNSVLNDDRDAALLMEKYLDNL